MEGVDCVDRVQAVVILNIYCMHLEDCREGKVLVKVCVRVKNSYFQENLLWQSAPWIWAPCVPVLWNLASNYLHQ